MTSFFRRELKDSQEAMFKRAEGYQAEAAREKQLEMLGNLLRQFVNNPDQNIATRLRQELILEMKKNNFSPEDLRRGAVAAGFSEQETTQAMLKLNLQ